MQLHLVMRSSESRYSIIRDARNNSPQPEEVLGIRKITSDVHCTPRSSKTARFGLVMDSGKTLEDKVNATIFDTQARLPAPRAGGGKFPIEGTL